MMDKQLELLANRFIIGFKGFNKRQKELIEIRKFVESEISFHKNHC